MGGREREKEREAMVKGEGENGPLEEGEVRKIGTDYGENSIGA